MARNLEFTDAGAYILASGTIGGTNGTVQMPKDCYQVVRIADDLIELVPLNGAYPIGQFTFADVSLPSELDMDALEVALRGFFTSTYGYEFFTVVDIPKEQLKGEVPYDAGNNLGDGIEVLPAIAGAYYDWKLAWEYTYATAQYSTGASSLTFYNYDGVVYTSVVVLNGACLSYAGDRAFAPIAPQMNISNVIPSMASGGSLVLRATNQANATNGFGSVKLKIWYNVIYVS